MDIKQFSRKYLKKWEISYVTQSVGSCFGNCFATKICKYVHSSTQIYVKYCTTFEKKSTKVINYLESLFNYLRSRFFYYLFLNSSTSRKYVLNKMLYGDLKAMRVCRIWWVVKETKISFHSLHHRLLSKVALKSFNRFGSHFYFIINIVIWWS